uniref:Ig-like domain-containing protein n=1 Tax=Lepisosteus oculatus TaxID=7918 RepID=W5MQ43_LEPOC
FCATLLLISLILSPKVTYSFIHLYRMINSLRGQEGGSVTVQCRYDSYYDTSTKYWCKGRERSTCKTVKVSVRDDPFHRVFTMTLNSLEKKDEDWYWCAIERTGVDYGIPLYLAVYN